jgi:membrane protein DedA with SNARE-associated domain
MSPQKSAAISVIGLVLMGWLIFSTDEAPSTALATIQYVAIAACLIGLVGSLVKMRRGS